MIERYGSGIGRIKRACEQYGLPEPVFEESQQGFRVTPHKHLMDEGVNLLHQLIQYLPRPLTIEVNNR